LLAAVALAAGLGVLGAWLVGDDGQSPAGELGPVAGAAEVASAGDPAIKFPLALEGLEAPPSDLVIDPQAGELWFSIFSDNGHKLYRYDPTTDGLEHYDLPSDPGGTGLFSAILVDERGHVLVGYGLTVADFDPVAEKFSVFALPETPANLEVLDANMKPFITDMIALDGKLLIGRLNTAALTELDTNNGDVVEHPIPSSFGCAINMVAADGVYMSNWIGFGKERQVARLDIKTDAFEPLAFGASALAADAQGGILAAKMDEAALASVDGTLASSLDVKEAGDILSGINDALAVDGRSGTLWFTGNRGTIARLDPATSAVTVYELPRYVVPANVIRGVAGEPPTDRIQATWVGGLTVDAEGNLYFSDQTAKRIGIIPAP